MLRLLCFVAGLCALAALAHKTIVSGDGYASPDAYVTIAAAGLVVALAVAVGHVWRNGHYIIAFGMMIALIAGDVYQFGRTVDQEMQRRAAAQAPLVEADSRRTEAAQRVAKAEIVARGIGASSPRLKAATAAHEVALKASRDDASKRGCASNCRKLHESAIAAALAEVQNAHAAIDAQRQAAQIEVDHARAALAAIPVPHSASSAADLLGWSAIVFNALLAALKASALNIGAIFALAYAGHGRISKFKPTVQPVANHRDHVARFALDCYDKSASGTLKLAEVRADYVGWCRASGARPLPVGKFEEELASLVSDAKLPVECGEDGRVIIKGMAPRKLLAAA